MVIRKDRDTAGEAIAAYLRGEIDNFALDDATLGRSKDQTITQIGLAIWRCYDDTRRHHVRLTRANWQAFRRCIAFLQTDLEYQKPRGKIDTSAWPFRDWRSIYSAKPHLRMYQLPRYDPRIHNVPLGPQIVTLREGVICILVVTAMMLWLCWSVLHGH